jgi:hypothetical protein
VEGVITRLTKFGAFARLEGDLEGLIHISEISENRIEHPKEAGLHEGSVVTLRIIRIDPDQRRIGLSLRKVDSGAYKDLDLKQIDLEGVSLDGMDLGTPPEPLPTDEPPAEEATPGLDEMDLGTPPEPLPTDEPPAGEATPGLDGTDLGTPSEPLPTNEPPTEETTPGEETPSVN